jgi:hypothetical protein
MTRTVVVLAVAAAMTMGAAVAWAFECPARLDETRVAVQKAETALDKAKAGAVSRGSTVPGHPRWGIEPTCVAPMPQCSRQLPRCQRSNLRTML